MVLFIYGRGDEFELDVEYDEKQGERKFFGICNTDNQKQVNMLIEELISVEGNVELNELYKYLQEVSQGEITLESNRRNGMACKCNKDKFRDEFLGKLKESRRNIDNKLENPLFIAGYMESVDYLEDIFNYTWQEHMEEDDE